MEQMDLLLAFEKIMELAKDSSLGDEFYQKADAYLGYVSGKLGISKRDGAILSLFANKYGIDRIELTDFAEYLGCRILSLLRYTNEIQELMDKEYIFQHKSDGLYYSFSFEAMEAFRHNQDLVPREVSGLTESLLFEEFNILFDKNRHKGMGSQTLRRKLETLICKNENLNFVKMMRSYGIGETDYLFPLFIRFCTLYVKDLDDVLSLDDGDELFDEDDVLWRLNKASLADGNHNFFRIKFIENTCDNGLVDRETFKITDEAKNKLFSGLNITTWKDRQLRDSMIFYKDIKPKSLFYNSKEQQQVEELSSLLEEKNYRKILDRLKKTNFRCGFACLFYGAPGTGKTETVLQIARHTGRDLIQINVSDIKSMWVGESEKNIKRIFDAYKKKVRFGDKAPILLFNEADAIIGKRKVGAEESVERMENSIQNIILQEMEQLDGILIATTNLVENMDKAFERRFLYKIKFERPDLTNRSKIWQSMIPQLSVSDSKNMAQEYDFSGGEIENVARHLTVQTILHGDAKDILGNLREYCDNERLSLGKTKRKVGF